MMKKKIVGVITVLVLFFTLSTQVLADGYTCPHGYRTFGDYILNGGVGDYGAAHRYYWVSDLDNTYRGYAANAVSDWVFTDIYTPISILETNVQIYSAFDLYDEYLGANYYGQTTFWNYDMPIDLNIYGALTQDYGWTTIEINSSSLDYYNFTAAQKQATIGHEFGHAMGLSHRNDTPGSIMCQIGNRTAIAPAAIDLYTINHLY